MNAAGCYRTKLVEGVHEFGLQRSIRLHRFYQLIHAHKRVALGRQGVEQFAKAEMELVAAARPAAARGPTLRRLSTGPALGPRRHGNGLRSGASAERTPRRAQDPDALFGVNRRAKAVPARRATGRVRQSPAQRLRAVHYPHFFGQFVPPRFGLRRYATGGAESSPRGNDIIQSLQPTPQRHGPRMAIALAGQKAAQLRNPPDRLRDRRRCFRRGLSLVNVAIEGLPLVGGQPPIRRSVGLESSRFVQVQNAPSHDHVDGQGSLQARAGTQLPCFHLATALEHAMKLFDGPAFDIPGQAFEGLDPCGGSISWAQTAQRVRGGCPEWYLGAEKLTDAKDTRRVA